MCVLKSKPGVTTQFEPGSQHVIFLFLFCIWVFFHEHTWFTGQLGKEETISLTPHCVKSVHIRSYYGPHFPAFGLNTERYSVSLRIESKCGKIRTRITPNIDTFYTVPLYHFHSLHRHWGVNQAITAENSPLHIARNSSRDPFVSKRKSLIQKNICLKFLEVFSSLLN